jgi:hypothetical protein
VEKMPERNKEHIKVYQMQCYSTITMTMTNNNNNDNNDDDVHCHDHDHCDYDDDDNNNKSLSVALLFLQQKMKPAFRYLLRTSHIHKSQNLKSVS